MKTCHPLWHLRWFTSKFWYGNRTSSKKPTPSNTSCPNLHVLANGFQVGPGNQITCANSVAIKTMVLSRHKKNLGYFWILKSVSMWFCALMRQFFFPCAYIGLSLISCIAPLFSPIFMTNQICKIGSAKIFNATQISAFCQIQNYTGPRWSKISNLSQIFNMTHIAIFCQISNFAGLRWSKIWNLSQIFTATQPGGGTDIERWYGDVRP